MSLDYEVSWHGALWREFTPPVVATPIVRVQHVTVRRAYGAVRRAVRGAFRGQGATIAEVSARTGLTQDQARYAIKRLVRLGILECESVARGTAAARYQPVRKAAAA